MSSLIDHIEMNQTDLIFDDLNEPQKAKRSSRGISKLDLGITFKDSLKQGAFGWYPYVEGFSASYIQNVLKKYRPQNVYDPFGGSGTTCLAASKARISSFYSEVNPFMVFVTETKVNGSIWARSHQEILNRVCSDFIARLRTPGFEKQAQEIDLAEYHNAFPNRNFFEEAHLRELLCARNIALEYAGISRHAGNLLLLACASNAVRSSNMTRRADLRRRRADEYKNRVVNVRTFIADSVERLCIDINEMPSGLISTTKVSENAKSIPEEFEGKFDFSLTSPPYLNGTNYFRNTKIELWLLGFIATEQELAIYNRQAVAAGINNVSKAKNDAIRFTSVEKVVNKLVDVAVDDRIPMLVRHYFSDMYRVFLQVRKALSAGAKFVLDIGDSKFYGIHVPTDSLLVDVAKESGLNIEQEIVVARRHSRDKSELRQVEITFSKPEKLGRAGK